MNRVITFFEYPERIEALTATGQGMVPTDYSFADYEERALSTAVYPNKGSNIFYPALKLCGEAGEVAEKIGKAIRDDNSQITPERRLDLIKELGDVLWYIAALASELGTTLDQVAMQNTIKLLDRKARGVIHGSGDNR